MFFTTIASGSKGNCTLVGTETTKILVDGGISATRIAKALIELGEHPSQIKGIFITHEHKDHIAGVENLAKKYRLKVFASPKTWECLPFKETLPLSQKVVYTYDMTVGDLAIDFCKTCHDATQPVGLIFSHQEKKLGYVTDTGVVTNSMLHKLKNLDGVILEANHNLKMLADGPYPWFLKKRILSTEGHLSNLQSARFLKYLIANSSCKQQADLKVVLAHLSEMNNTPKLARSEVEQELDNLGTVAGFELFVAPSAKALPKIYL